MKNKCFNCGKKPLKDKLFCRGCLNKPRGKIVLSMTNTEFNYDN